MWWGATFTSLAWCGEKVCLENLDQCCSKASKLVYVPPGIVPLNSETLQEWWFHSPSRPLCQCCIPLIREKIFCVSSCDFPWYNLWLMAFVFSLLAARWVWLHPCSNPAPSASPYVPSAPPPAVIVAFYCTHCQYLSCVVSLKAGHIIPDVTSWGLNRGEQPLSLVWKLTHLMLDHIMCVGTHCILQYVLLEISVFNILP